MILTTVTLHYSAKGDPDRLVCTPTNDAEKSILVSVPGARPQASGLIYFNPDVFVLRDLQRLLFGRLEVDATLVQWYEEAIAKQKEHLRITQQKDIDLPLEVTTHLRDYQRIGAKWLSQVKRGLLYDDCGLGKTLESLVATKLIDAQSVLIVTLATAKWQWKDEIKHWLDEDAVIVEGTPQERLALINSDPKYLIIHYDILREAIGKPATENRSAQKAKYLRLVRRKWDAVIFDEAHKLQGHSTSKNGSQQSKAASAVTRNVPHVFQLTGTPIWNMPSSEWNLLHILDPAIFPSYWTYVNTYFTVEETNWAKKVTGVKPAKAAEHKQLFARYAMGRHKIDVAQELPPKIYTTMHYDLSQRQWKDYKAIRDSLRLEYESDVRHFSNVASTLISMRKLCNNPEELGLPYDSPKDAVLLELVENALTRVQKVAILCWHKGYAAHIQNILLKKKITSVLATGDTDAKERIEAVTAFQYAETPVLIGTIGAIGTALNLGYITEVFFAEKSWTPPENEQATDRFHRLTSTEPVNITDIIGRGTIEQHIKEVVEKKSHLADETLAIQAVVEAILAHSDEGIDKPSII